MASSLRRIAGQNVRIFCTRDGREVELVAVLPTDRGLGMSGKGVVVGIIVEHGTRWVMCWRKDGGNSLHPDDARASDLVDLPSDLAVTPAPDGFQLEPDVDAGELAPRHNLGHETANPYPLGGNQTPFDFPEYGMHEAHKAARRELLEELVGPIMKQMVGPVERKNDVVLGNIEARIIVAALQEAGYGDKNP